MTIEKVSFVLSNYVLFTKYCFTTFQLKDRLTNFSIFGRRKRKPQTNPQPPSVANNPFDKSVRAVAACLRPGALFSPFCPRASFTLRSARCAGRRHYFPRSAKIPKQFVPEAAGNPFLRRHVRFNDKSGAACFGRIS